MLNFIAVFTVDNIFEQQYKLKKSFKSIVESMDTVALFKQEKPKIKDLTTKNTKK